MPLEFVVRFRCDECAMELSLVGTCTVASFPFIIEKAGVRQPPDGWTVEQTTCKCPTHASRVKLANTPALIRALKSH